LISLSLETINAYLLRLGHILANEAVGQEVLVRGVAGDSVVAVVVVVVGHDAYPEVRILIGEKC